MWKKLVDAVKKLFGWQKKQVEPVPPPPEPTPVVVEPQPSEPSVPGAAKPDFDYVTNIKTDWGAFGDGGVNPDGPAFDAFRTYALSLGQARIKLILPRGNYQWTADPVGDFFFGGDDDNNCSPFRLIKNITIEGTDASIYFIFHGSSGFIQPVTSIQSFIDDASAGDDSVTLLNPAHASRYTKGQMVCVGGLDMQGFGFPLNLNISEYKRVLSVVGSVVQFETPLEFSYSREWPLNFIDFGGPAALYAMNEPFDVEHYFHGISFLRDDGFPFVYSARRLEFHNCTWAHAGPAPSGSQIFRIVNSRPSPVFGFVEVDKVTDLLDMHGFDVRRLDMQSASLQQTNLTLSNIHEQGIFGLPTSLTIDRTSIIDLNMGTPYGQCKELVIRDSVISGLDWTFGMSHPAGQSLSTLTYDGVNSFSTAAKPSWANSTAYAINDVVFDSVDGQQHYVCNVAHSSPGVGTFAVYRTANPTHWSAVGLLPFNWAVPDAYAFFLTPDNGIFYHPFRITDVRQSGSSTVIETTLSGALPTSGGGVPTALWLSPAPSITVTNSSGCKAIEELSRKGTEHAFGEYSFRTYTNVDQEETHFFLGELISLKVNVIRPYTGSAVPDLWLWPCGLGGLNSILTIDGTTSAWQPKINLKVAGERIFTPGGNTGIEASDVEDAPTPEWMGVGALPLLDRNAGGADLSSDAESERPIVTVEWILDQGLGAL